MEDVTGCKGTTHPAYVWVDGKKNSKGKDMTESMIGKLYEEYREDIVRMAHSYAGQTQEHVDDLIADASLGFLEAVRGFEDGRGDIKARIVDVVWNRWLDNTRKRRRTHRKVGGVEDRNDSDDFSGSRKYVREAEEKTIERSLYIHRMESASEDADALVRLTLDPPLDIQANAEVIRRKYSKAMVLRQAIIEYLQDIGWAMSRIEEGFREVGEMLNGR